MKENISELSPDEFQILFNALTEYRQRGSVKPDEFEQISQLQEKLTEWWEAGFEEIGNEFYDDKAAKLQRREEQALYGDESEED